MTHATLPPTFTSLHVTFNQRFPFTVDLSSAADLRVESKLKLPKSKSSSERLSSEGEESPAHSFTSPVLQTLIQNLSSAEPEDRRTRSLSRHTPGSGASLTARNAFSRSTNMQPVHGRVDWTAKYGGRQ